MEIAGKVGRQGTRTRTHITLEMKVHLLKLCVEHNPFEKSEVDVWPTIITNMRGLYSIDFQSGSLLKIMRGYLVSYKADQLKFKTGKEEQMTEMKELLETLVGYEETAKLVPTSIQTVDLENGPPTSPATNKVMEVGEKKEKQLANEDRDKLMNSNFAPEPSPSRGKRSVSIDDEMIQKKQEQDHEIQLKRIRLEEKESIQKFELEQRRLDIEADRIKANQEDSKRKDELQTSQLEIQRSLLLVMEALLKK